MVRDGVHPAFERVEEDGVGQYVAGHGFEELA